jgi:thiol:disulfide interchange protein DsbD
MIRTPLPLRPTVLRLVALWLAALLPLAAAAPTMAAADAATAIVPAAHKADDFLDPDVAFRLAARVASPGKVGLDWAIAPGYYLYQQRLKFAASTPGVTLGKAELPAGDTKHDEYFGEQVVYHRELRALLPYTGIASGTLEIAVTYQGCAEKGLCYPPITKKFTLALPKAAAADGGAASGGGSDGGSGNYVSEQDRLAALIRGGSLWLMLGTFFGIGLLLAFTPCVLPMVPILSGLIAGQGKDVTTGRAFALSFTYVMGMALTYTIAGAAFAAAGHQVQAVFQQPWIVLLFAALFIALALSMFGLYTIQMPAAIQTRLTGASNSQRAGTFGGAAVMGALSALIVTACVAPALVATLVVIGQGGNVVRGAAALFAMSFGMGTPLLVVGASAGRLLPRAGAWMDAVKQLFGALMLGVAAWMLARLVGDRWSLLLYAVPMVAAGVVLLRVQARSGGARLGSRVAAAAGFVAALLLVVGAVRGATDPLHPLANPAAAQAREAAFEPIHSVAELDAVVAQAAAAGQPVMLDFYADWCASCKEMERYTFSDPTVRSQLGNLRLLRADVTANNDDDQALLKRFGIFGPPTIAFYDRAGQEQPAYRVVGYMKAGEFASLLQRLAAAPAALADAGA